VNGDDAATPAGELGFIWREWSDYTKYHMVTMYNVLVNTTYFTIYNPCDEGESCSYKGKNPKHVGMTDFGFVGIPVTPAALQDGEAEAG
jgi:hypothetical protein